MKTEVRLHNGSPSLFVDDTPHHGLLSSTPAKFMRNVLDAGFDVVDTHPFMPLGWVGPNTYDYTATDARVESYLTQSPDAKLIIRFWLGYPQDTPTGQPYWWTQLHPEECIRPLPVEDGQPMPWDDLALPVSWNQLIASNEVRPVTTRKPVHPPKPSFASLRFREEAGEALRRAVAHLEERYGDRIFGYVTGGGPCGEWFHWHADEARMMDTSDVMLHAFHQYLQTQYSTIAALNQSWNTSHASFTDIPLPTPEARFLPAHGYLRSAVTERAVLDFYAAYHQTVADTLLHWTAQTKAGCGRQKVVMVFYGYLWNHNYRDSQARSGHACLDAVLRSPDVDVLVAPFCYSLRQMDGVITGQGVAGSARRHGKLYLHELDGGTNLLSCWNSPDHHVPKTPAETGELFRRELNKMLCEGSAGWYMDLRGGYYDSPEVIAELRTTLEHGARLRPTLGQPNNSVVVVLDPKAPFNFREGEPLLSPLVDLFRQFELAQMGLGFEEITLDDLLRLSPNETAAFKFWIFPCAVNLSPEQQAAIRHHACRHGNHVLWNYAVNVCGSTALDFDGLETLTGFRCGASLEPGELVVTVPPGPHPWTADLTRELVYGTRGDLSPDDIRYHAVLGRYPTQEEGFRISPRFFIEAGGEKLGTLQDIPDNPCGLAVRTLNDWVSILSCAPLLPKVLLRKIAASAGCHVYTKFPGQVVQCNEHVGIFFHADGPCEINLPHRATRVIELYSGTVVGENCDAITLQARRNHAILLHFPKQQ